jgi:hypothetical protein
MIINMFHTAPLLHMTDEWHQRNVYNMGNNSDNKNIYTVYTCFVKKLIKRRIYIYLTWKLLVILILYTHYNINVHLFDGMSKIINLYFLKFYEFLGQFIAIWVRMSRLHSDCKFTWNIREWSFCDVTYTKSIRERLLVCGAGVDFSCAPFPL